MAVRLKKVLLWAVVLVVVLVLAGFTAIGWQVVLGPKKRAVTDRTFERTPERLARGKYLTSAVAPCFHCHTEPDLKDPNYLDTSTRQGAGWRFPEDGLGELYVPNITSDPETGIGAWTDDEVARAIQEGVSKDGRALFPIMPYMNFRNMDDEDLASIVVFIRTLPPVKHALPKPKLVFPLNYLVNTMPQPLPAHTPANPPRTTAQARGEYLVKNLASCSDCHTPTNQGNPLPGMFLAGGGQFEDLETKKPIASLNITPDVSGIAHFDEALFISAIRTAKVVGRPLNLIMPTGIYKHMTDEDLKDVWAYLQTVPKASHRVSNTDPPTPCPVCNMSHGLGNLNKAPATK